MIIPTLLHDEWLEGYRGRFARLNALHSRHDLEPALNAWLGTRLEDQPGPKGFIPMIALALGRPIVDIVMNHTLWPTLKAVDRPDSREFIEGKAASPSEKKTLSRAVRKHNWLCPECATADVWKLHFSYWRRSHQLAGQFFCRWHAGFDLQSVNRTAFMEEKPHEMLDAGSQQEGKFIESVRRNAHIARALSISNAILDGQFRPRRESDGQVLRQRAQTLGLKEYATKHYPDVKSLVRAHFPMDWLRHVMPDVIGSRLESLLFVDHVFNPKLTGLSGSALAIVASVLYDTSDIALNELRGSVSGYDR